MTLPPIKAGVQESVQAYVLRRLVDAGKPLTSEEIGDGAPSHIAPTSVSKACSRLYAIAVLGRQRLINGKKGVTYQWYIADLGRIPQDFCWEAHPERSHTQPRRRRKFTTEPSPLSGKCDGVTNIQEEPVMADTADASGVYRETATMQPLVATKLATLYVPDAAPAPKVTAPAEPKPGIVIVYGGKARHLSTADAKAIYRQLEEIFG